MYLELRHKYVLTRTPIFAQPWERISMNQLEVTMSDTMCEVYVYRGQREPEWIHTRIYEDAGVAPCVDGATAESI
jgi:hypothetical protein